MRLCAHNLIFAISVMLLVSFGGACNRNRGAISIKSVIIRAKARDQKPESKPCKATTKVCTPCEYRGNQLCIMSLDWLSSLGDSETQHPPVLVHPTDDVFWIGASGETQLNVRLDKMAAVDCDTEKPLHPTVAPPFGPFDYDNNQHRVEHTKANGTVNGVCFKNYIEYTDPDTGDTLTVDPHIYVGDGSDSVQ